jgi:hypothetical protein
MLVVVALLSAACASRSPDSCNTPAAPADSWRDVPQATSRAGVAHICPFAPNLAYTSRHVVVGHQGRTLYFIPLTWQQGDKGGSLFPLYTDARRDLAIGCTDEGFSRWFERAELPPEPGDKLFLPAHKWLESGAPRERVEATVAEVVGGMIRLKARPMSASSGACLMNEDGLLVAIHDWSLVGGTVYAAAVWGEWGAIPTKWRDREVYGWVAAEEARGQGCAAEFLVPKEEPDGG